MERPAGAELRLGEPRVLTRGRERSERNGEQNVSPPEKLTRSRGNAEDVREVLKISLRTSRTLREASFADFVRRLEKTFGRQQAGSLFREVFSSLMRGKPFLKKRFFPSNSPFLKTLVRGENSVGTTNNQSAPIRLIRKIRERVDPHKTTD